MEKNFDFKRAEQELSQKWISSKIFTPKVNSNKEPFTIIMPPPNITSKLHIGHAFEYVILDAISRYKRMQGFETLLLPGADHAAIATEVKVVEELRKQGIEKRDLTREQFMTHIHKWYDIHMEQIKNQMMRLGLSADWSRFSFTMDDRATKAVKHAFKHLYDKGFIYKGDRMVNFCTSCGSALCDAEVEHVDKDQILYQITFPFKDSASQCITIATVRPEVIFGDAAIAVNPKDKRYKDLIGKKVVIPLTDISIPIIVDDYVDMKFGTGALQITPCHAHSDYDIAKKHNLVCEKIFDNFGNLIGTRVGQFAGLSITDARQEVVKQLKQQGHIKSEKKHTSSIAVCYRCKSTVEPTLSKQWFVRMKELAKRAKDALATQKNPDGLSIIPKKFEKIYLHWLNNIKDWCISRQITSGHKIPLEGEDDVLDTWFSSALWPLCTLGWPEKTPDFNYFYPTQVMVMGYEILFFWGIRMIFSGLEYTNQLPFNTLIFHGIVRDAKGIKMSKSLGNGIDPLDAIEEFGADALRFSLVSGTKLDRDPRYSIEKATLARNFINKVWNAVNFFQIQTSQIQEQSEIDFNNLSIPDKWILTKLNALVKSVTKKYEKYDLGVAANELQSFFWYDFCDFYLEAIKTVSNKPTALAVAKHTITNFLKLLHPIMPFITEEIFCNILKRGDSLATQEWPDPLSKSKWNKSYPKEKKEFDTIVNLIAELKLPKKDAGRLSENPQEVKHLANQYREKQIILLQKEIARGEQMLANQGFLARAPKELVSAEQEKLTTNRSQLKFLLAQAN